MMDDISRRDFLLDLKTEYKIKSLLTWTAFLFECATLFPVFRLYHTACPPICSPLAGALLFPGLIMIRTK